jgi:Tetratricopeptide repeat
MVRTRIPRLAGLGGPRSYSRVLARWRRAVDKLSEDEIVDAKSAFDEDLRDAESADDYEDARQTLRDLAYNAEAGAKRLRTLAAYVTTLQEDWAATRRYTEAGLDALVEELTDTFGTDPVAGARRWLAELFDAIRLREYAAARTIATGGFAFADEQASGAERIERDLAAWLDGNEEAGLGLLDALARANVDGWKKIIDVPARTRAHRLAAWIALRRLGDPSLAAKHLDDALELDSLEGPNNAERASLDLFSGELERAAPVARRAIEFAPSDPSGYVALGAWAELVGQFDDARDLFARALDRMPVHMIATIPRRASILDPPGALLLAAAERLLRANRPDNAVEAADAAFQMGVLGPTSFPEADAFRVRSRALEKTGRGARKEAASAAVEAGKRYLWNEQIDEAIEELSRTRKLDDSIAEAAWLLADALTVKSLPSGAAVPDDELVERARSEWEKAAKKFKPPAGALSWAFLTRAAIADLASYAPGQDRGLGSFEAVLHVERALVHDEGEPRRWGLAARHMRACGLDNLGLEAVERGYAVGPSDSVVLSERLALLANLNRLEEAARAAEEWQALYGEDPWLNGVLAWIAYHEDRPQHALKLLEQSIALDADPTWSYGLRINSRLALGDIEGAREDSKALVERDQPISLAAGVQIALAQATLGDRDHAREVLGETLSNATARATDSDYLFAKFFLAMLEDDVDAGEELLREALRNAPTVRDVDTTVKEAKHRLLLTDEKGRERREAAVERAVGVAAARRSELEANPPSADRELSLALANDVGASGSDLDIPTAGLLAIRGRRLFQIGLWLDSAADYERLRWPSFEPEASVALERALTNATSERMAARDVVAVIEIQEKLERLGLTDPVQAGLAVAAAIEADDRRDDARAHLTRLLERYSRDARIHAVHQRLGELWLRSGDLDQARASFETALEIARRRDDFGRCAELEARLGVLSLAATGEQAGAEHLRAALDAWSSAGAYYPAGPLEADLHGLSQPADGSVAEAVREALTYLKERLEPALASDDAARDER